METVLDKMGRSIPDFVGSNPAREEVAEGAALQALQGRTDIGETQKQQLVSARRGQGIFKANVRLNEKRCRVTGITNPRLLIASHIKPWAKSSDHEKLDGCNGLFLSPHIDRLFDRGLISFADDGTLLRSSELDIAILNAWGIPADTNVGAFTPNRPHTLRITGPMCFGNRRLGDGKHRHLARCRHDDEALWR